ncbi:ribonuclease III [Amorphus orientalis]|uniref:Ribonuclease 3 n=1 Tax=Amorphus orientalis TaxID=649198 RepID=A0AAE4ATA5_9HYPH|nr:ribonuclease III [Amorphus orientalis]MDQ0316078.1 ribonuclease-3 [Amorphus orientalis]
MTGRNGGGLADVEAVLGHRFADPDLLRTALTHASALSSSSEATQSYQRLEFLGDRVLGLSVAALLYRAYPEADEGELAQRYNQLVRGQTCAEVARDWNLDKALVLGAGENQSKAKPGTAVLADACEAVLGALYIDAGYEAVSALVEREWGPRMRKAIRPARDAKTTLQEWVQARGEPTPAYRPIGRSGPDHAPRFTVEVDVNGIEPGRGHGGSKREAEQNAARAVLVREGVWSDDGDTA